MVAMILALGRQRQAEVLQAIKPIRELQVQGPTLSQKSDEATDKDTQC